MKAGATLPAALKDALRVKYDVVLGFGLDCANAAYLRTAGLRTVSSPFDWVAGWEAGFDEYVRLALSEFEGLLELEDLEIMPHPSGPNDDVAHEYVRNVRNHLKFFHDFPRGLPCRESFAGVNAKYNRRCRRFCELMRSSGSVLLTQWNRTEKLELEHVSSALVRLRAHFGNPRIDLLVLCDDPRSVDFKVHAGNGAIVATAHIFKSEIHVVMGDVDLCRDVYSAIRAKGRVGRLFKRWIRYRCRKLVRRLSTSFHWRSCDRRRAREEWDNCHGDNSGLKD